MTNHTTRPPEGHPDELVWLRGYEAGFKDGVSAPRTGVEAMMLDREREFEEMVKNYDFENDEEWKRLQAALVEYAKKRGIRR